jgi:PAS domain S-box-containing protein
MVLSRSETHFREMADTLPTLIWVSDAHGLLTFLNQPWADLTGRTVEELQDDGWVECVHPVDRQRCQEMFYAAVQARRSFAVEYRVRCFDGNYHWLLDHGVPRMSPAGSYLGHIGSCLDITERKEVEAALRASEERYRNVVEAQTDLICRYLPDTTLTFVNDAYCRFFGKTRRALLGSKFLDLLPESAVEAACRHVRSLIETPRVVANEHEVLLPDGNIGWQQWVDHAIFDRHGKIVEFQGIGRDITERKRAEEAMRESERRYRTIFHSAAVSILEADISEVKRALARLQADGVTDVRRYLADHPEFVRWALTSMQILDINETCLKMFGADDRRALMGSLDSIFLPETRQVLSEELVALADGRSAFESETIVQTLQGQRLNILYTSAFPPPTAAIDSILVTFMDITERKRAQEEIQALAGRLLSAQEEERRWVARELHDDVTQRLAVLAIETGKLERQVPTGQHVLRRQLQSLHEQIVTLSADVHGLSRKLHPSILDDLGLVDALAAECGRLSGSGGLQVRFTNERVPEVIPRNIALCLYRIAQEALHNILKYAQAQEVQVILAGRGDGIRLRLHDDGIGFDLAHARRKGGLGLASMRERLRLIDGRLAIRTRPGAGTHIDVWVPLNGRQR